MKNILTIFIIILFFFLWASVGWGATYYVDPSCGTPGNGSSGSCDGDANDPFDSLDDVNSALSDTDDVYFLAGTTLNLGTTSTTEKINLYELDGTTINPIVIGCYWMEGGSENTDCTGKTYPILDGVRDGQGTPLRPNGLQNEGVIDKQDNNATHNTGNVTITQIHIRDSGAAGIYFVGPNSATYDGYNVIIDDVIISYIDQTGIVLANYINCQVIESRIDQVVLVGTVPFNAGSGIALTGNGVVDNSYNTTVARNKISNCQECISGFARTRDNIIEDNLIWDNRDMGIYFERSRNNIIKNNLIYGSSSRPNAVSGIWLNNENEVPETYYCYMGGNEIYGNMVANTDHGVYIGCARCIPNPTCWQEFDTKIYNNTFVNNETNIHFSNWTGNSGANSSSILIKNNISKLYSSGFIHISASGDSINGVTYDYNLFNGIDTVTGNAMDNYRTGDPNLSTDTEAAWESLSSTGNVDGTEFATEVGGDGIDNGTSIASYNDRITASDFTATPITVTTETDSSPDIGAWMYGAGGISAPDYPLQGVKLNGVKYN